MKVAINGFGRIGRQVLRQGLASTDLEFVAINDLNPIATLGHLFKYDSVHGAHLGTVQVEKDSIVVDGRRIQVCSESSASKLPWKKLNVDLVMECTGRYTSKELAVEHLTAGAKKVIVSAPCRGGDVTVVMGVNEGDYDSKKHHVISNASCTTNCLGIVAKVLRDEVGINRAFMTTVHSYTNDQRVLDNAHKDLRRARAAGLSMIPTTSGATKALSTIFPELKGSFEGLSVRVPTPNVSLIDLVAELKGPVTATKINEYFDKAVQGELSRYLGISREPLVSSDFIGNKRSAVVDASLTQVIGGNLIKVIAWYDNEVGFSARMIDLAHYIYGH